MKPKPFASLNHFTFPVAMTETFLRGSMPLLAPAVIAVLSDDIDQQTKTPREPDLARRVSRTSKHQPSRPAPSVGCHEAPRGVNQILTGKFSRAQRRAGSGGPRNVLPGLHHQLVVRGEPPHDRRPDALGHLLLAPGPIHHPPARMPQPLPCPPHDQNRLPVQL